MKLDIIIVDLLVVALVLVPCAIFIWAGLKDAQGLKRKFLEEVKKYNLHPDQIGTWNLNMAGLDTVSRSFLLVQDYAGKFEISYINLQKVGKSSIVKSYKTIKIREEKEEVLQRIDLELLLHSGEIQLVNLYDSNKTYQQDYEVKNAENWNLLINSCLSSRPVLGAAA